ncbi:MULTISPECIES: hypothetical protein [unclassified Ensifer]|uniref:hypothetical protein n=1 Tax=unclassified Ensifer TaxID=2633371 RepID=UPI0008136D12|nr:MULTISPECIES: hypothetical protein [unclassified Ensifer]OCP01321.1 hypothetical protein BC362_23095 [Ensifer sp. LC14]OCP03583.1 hypothetical protein BC374_06275 [Ensifer sp. LC13]
MERTDLIEGMKPCCVCAEPIRQEARKCSKCGSYQDWRSRIVMGATVLSTTLALLTALLAVAKESVPAIINAFKGEVSSLVFSLHKDNDDKLTILATNFGPLSETVNGGLVYIYSRYLSVSLKDNVSIIVKPTESVVFDLFPVNKELTATPGGSKDDQDCSISLKSSSAKGTEFWQELEVRCVDIELFHFALIQ